MLSGREFNHLTKLNGITTVKFMQFDKHNLYLDDERCKMGLNSVEKIDILFSKGFTFTFLESGTQVNRYCFRVSIPEDATVVVDSHGSFRTDQIVIEYQYDNSIRFYQYILIFSPHYIQYIENQTDELCAFAVCRNGLLLKYVKNKTPKICSLAIMSNPDALEFVNNM